MRDRAVLAAGASDGDRRVPLVLTLVAGHHGFERVRVGVEELARAGLAEHELADRLVFAGEVPKLGRPERIRQEPRVGDQVGVGREHRT